MPNRMTDHFGPPIDVYSAEQAVEDGVLVDISVPPFRAILRDQGVKARCYMTDACFGKTIATILGPDDPDPVDPAVPMIMRMLQFIEGYVIEVRKAPERFQEVHFTVPGINDDLPTKVWGKTGNGSDGKPIITFMLEGED